MGWFLVHFPRRTGRIARAGAALAAATLAAIPLAAPAQAQQAKVLRVALTTGIDHLNPFTASLAASTQVGRFIYEFLTVPSAETAQASPALAESWTPSPDKLTWTFKIRSGAKWSDGQPVTAKDAAFTFNRMLTDENARTANGSYVTNFETVTAPDDTTLVIKTKTVQSDMNLLDVPIVPEHVWAPIKDLNDPKTDDISVVGVDDGPYQLTEYKQNEYVKFKANKNYWRGAPQVDELQLLVFKDAEAAVNALRQGEVDVINRLTPTQFDALKNQPGITTNAAPGRRYDEINLNFGVQNSENQPIGDGNPALKDIRLRKAIVQAIDRQTVVDRVTGGHAQIGTGIIPPIYHAYHWEPAPDEQVKFDIAAANAALDQAGYAKGPDGVRVAPGGGKLELRLTGHANRPYDQRLAQYVSGWLKDIGITVKQELVSDDELNDRTNAGKYDLAVSGYATNPDPDSALQLHTCAARPNAQGKGATTDTFFCDPEYDRLRAAQLAETDDAKRAGIVKQAQARLASQAVNVVLDYQNSLEAYRSDKFSGFTKQPQPEGAILEQSGYWGVYGATPAGSQSAADSGSGSTVVWIVVGAVVVIVLVGGGIMLGRRGKSAEDRE
ncbi:ABC transporter substrate-binding protein [Amycolatopsis australiensis]|uniref:Peptide/nickel transport system substrate-binding protein n=1 Tax=Amycolatopsis australiensis TaxID=546364 RepID=A0A1K1SE54_9PSEU|nr:ABC transporter substrate-binding protein [Amycolatopsis australiensis]SFW82665.1 peptide/nickel transport system substrate-binding protein [Amycolatopsis australiensis]